MTNKTDTRISKFADKVIGAVSSLTLLGLIMFTSFQYLTLVGGLFAVLGATVYSETKERRHKIYASTQ